MYFRAFTAIEGSPMPYELTFTIEYLASQMLAHCDREYLAQIVQDRSLIQGLYREIEFTGSVAHGLEEAIRFYLESHARTIYEVSEEVLRDPDNE